jgi:hypothetical protein
LVDRHRPRTRRDRTPVRRVAALMFGARTAERHSEESPDFRRYSPNGGEGLSVHVEGAAP